MSYQRRKRWRNEAESEKQHLPGFVNDGSQGVGQDALECDPAFPDGCDYSGKPRLGQNDTASRLGHVGGALTQINRNFRGRELFVAPAERQADALL